jgi:hypothetical protein
MSDHCHYLFLITFFMTGRVFILDLSIIKNIKCFVSVRVMVFNATFKNISVISCRSVLLLEETGVPRKNQRPAVSH